MVKKRRIVIISAAVIAMVILFSGLSAGLLMFQKFMYHESNQSQRLADLEGRIGLIEAKSKLAEGSTEEILCGGGLQLFSDWKQYY